LNEKNAGIFSKIKKHLIPKYQFFILIKKIKLCSSNKQLPKLFFEFLFKKYLFLYYFFVFICNKRKSMSQREYTSMSHMPSHGNASQAKVGNAREEFQMKQMGGQYGSMSGEYAPGMAGGKYMEMSCHFPQAPPKRCYCHPAAFTSLDGRSHQRLLDAYGMSRPCQHYY
jgi:hypothetical protein